MTEHPEGAALIGRLGERGARYPQCPAIPNRSSARDRRHRRSAPGNSERPQESVSLRRGRFRIHHDGAVARTTRRSDERGPEATAQAGFAWDPDDGVDDPDRFSREFLRKQAQYNQSQLEEPLPRLVLHGLRHTWATLALHEGIDIQIVSERLNYSSTFVTREIYTHVTPPMQSDAAQRVARAILRKRHV